jgi:hypothetical protein
MELSQLSFTKDNIKYRFLTNSDEEIYKNFVSKFHLMMKRPITEILENAILKGFNSKLRKTAGAFDENDNLLLAISGYYPENFSYWFGHNHMSTVKNLNKFTILSHYVDHLQCLYGEKIGMYAHYSRRPIGHQKAFDRLLLNKVLDTRYNIYYEKIYKSGEKCALSNHKFYFHLEDSFSFDTIITFHSLKQEHRKEILEI